jgi:hypothetical protein
VSFEAAAYARSLGEDVSPADDWRLPQWRNF